MEQAREEGRAEQRDLVREEVRGRVGSPGRASVVPGPTPDVG